MSKVKKNEVDHGQFRDISKYTGANNELETHWQ